MKIRFDLETHEYFSIAARRKWLILTVATIGLGLGWGIAETLPKSYRSTIVVLVENQKIPENYVSSTVSSSASERLTLINQYFLSRTIIGEVLDEMHLFETGMTQTQKDALIQRVKKQIKIEVKGGGRAEAFSISAAYTDPMIAQELTKRLTDRYLIDNLKNRAAFVAGTTEFLGRELAGAKTSLEEQELAIAQYQKKYLGELPDQLNGNIGTLTRLRMDSTQLEDILQKRMDRRSSLQKSIQAYTTMGLISLETPADSILDNSEGLRSKTVVRVGEGVGTDPLSARLRDLQSRLESLKSEYKDTYPDVVQLKNEIAQAKHKLEEREKELREKAKVTKSEDSRRVPAGKRVAGTTYLAQLEAELDELDAYIERLKEQQGHLQKQIEDYHARIERTPERQRELSILQRDYENTRKNYQSLLDKQLSARISENLEKQQQGETFKVLDPANLPSNAESPNVLMIMISGLLFGCGTGFCCAFVLEQLHVVIRDPDEMEKHLGLPVLSTIPNYDSAYSGDAPRFLADPNGHQGSDHGETGEMRRPLVAGKISGKVEGDNDLFARWKSASGMGIPKGRATSISERARQELALVAKWKPTSIVTEQYRVAATRLVLNFQEQKGGVVAITSAVNGEGKSTAASNLAYVLARDLGKRTLLIDCDFVHPMLNVYNGIAAKPGLQDAIKGILPIESCLHRSGELPLWILPLDGNEKELLDLRTMQPLARLVSEVRSNYDFIILDAPPILPLANMSLIGAMADMIIMVIRFGVTPQEIVKRARMTLKPQTQAALILSSCEAGLTPRYFSSPHYLKAGRSYLS